MSRPTQPSIGIDAGPRRDAVDQHRAGAAFAEPAAVFRSVQFEIVAQHVEQGGVRGGGDVMDPAVDRRRIVLCVISVVPLAAVALQTSRRNAEVGRYRLHTNVQARPVHAVKPLPGL